MQDPDGWPARPRSSPARRPASAARRSALFHAEGAKVAATDLNEAGLAELEGVADLVLPQDVTDEARWREVVDAAVAAFGRLDILVNSAGIGTKGNIETDDAGRLAAGSRRSTSRARSSAAARRCG